MIEPGAPVAPARAVEPHSEGPARPDETSVWGRVSVYIAVLAVLVMTAAGMIARGQITFSSDQAVVGLMALEIRDLGEHPVFYWGVQHAGTFEQHLLSLVFRVLPVSVAVYRGTMFVLLASGVLLVVAATERAFGRRAALVAGLSLSLGPSFFLYKELTSDGAYTSVFLALSLAFFLSVQLAGESSRRATLMAVGGLGVALGLAWWIHPLSAVFAPALVFAVLREPRRWIRLSNVSALLVGLLVGGLPWWVENIRTGMGSLRASEMTRASWPAVVSQARTLLENGLPVLLGGRSAWEAGSTFPGSRVVSIVVLVLVAAAASFQLARESDRRRRFLLFASLVLITLPPAQALVMARTDMTQDPRYLLPFYIGFAAVVGSVVDDLLARRRRVVVVALSAVLLSLGVGSQLTAHVFAGDPQHGKMDEAKLLVEALAAEGPRELYAGYWDAYRLTFLSGGNVALTPFAEGAFGPERSERLKARVDASPRPGFLLQSGPAWRMEAYLRHRGAQFSMRYLGSLQLTLFTDVPEMELSELRGCRCIPTVGAPAPR